MGEKKKDKDQMVIINKFNEKSSADVKGTIENAFKIFYKLQINKSKV